MITLHFGLERDGLRKLQPYSAALFLSSFSKFEDLTGEMGRVGDLRALDVDGAWIYVDVIRTYHEALPALIEAQVNAQELSSKVDRKSYRLRYQLETPSPNTANQLLEMITD